MIGSADDGTVSLVDPDAPEPLVADGSGLTATQASKVLVMLDDACSDAWCETDYQFSFRHITCDFPAHTCTLRMAVTLHGTTYARACKMTGLRSFSQLVGTSSNGYQWLTDGFWSRVDTCATKVESSI